VLNRVSVSLRRAGACGGAAASTAGLTRGSRADGLRGSPDRERRRPRVDIADVAA
jgi:hypothetical protein